MGIKRLCHKLSFLLLLLVFCLGFSYALAQEEISPSPFSLKELLQEALARNPELQEARARWEAKRERIAIEGWLEDPMIGADFEGIPRGTADLGKYTNIEYMISQAIPFPGKLSLKRKVAAQEAKITYELYRAKERDLVAQVKHAYHALYLLDRSLEVNMKNRARVDQFRRIAETRYVSGQTYRQDLLKTEVELSRLLNEQVMLEGERDVAVSRLNAILNRPSKTPLSLAAEMIEPRSLSTWEALEEKLIASRPELKMAQREIERMEAARSLARLSYLPDFTARVEARQFNGEGDIREYDTFLGITLPIWFWKNEATVKEATKSLEAAKEGYVSVQNIVVFEAQDAFVRVQSQEKQLKRYREEILLQAEQAFEEARKGYESGTSGFLDLLDAQRMLNMHELDYYRTLVDLEMAYADLERAVGTPLDGETLLTEEEPHVTK